MSLSAGTLGESFVSHELEIGIRRLEEFGLGVKFYPHALSGREYVEKHPEDRAADLLEAFRDRETDMILCAIGGEDTYRLLPYLFEHNELKKAVSDKIFLGFSDSTVNHFMLHKVGLNTFYGQSFLADVCDIGKKMLPYSEKYFRELISTGGIAEITPSDRWYESRTDFSPEAIGTFLPEHENRGFELLQGSPVFSGEILGGCLDTIFDIFDNTRFDDTVGLCARYGLFPEPEEWKGKILLLETSEEQMPPEKYGKAVLKLREAGVFANVSGVLLGKPMDGKYDAEYRKIITETIGNPDLPVLANISVGHALPRCIIPFGRPARVDAGKQTITFD